MQSKKVSIIKSELYFLPVQTRVPLKFGNETLTSVICARVKLTIENGDLNQAVGWGETPLNIQWIWPSSLSYSERLENVQILCKNISGSLPKVGYKGHALELGYYLSENFLKKQLDSFNHNARNQVEPIPWLAGLVCLSAFDIALHDAYGKLFNISTFDTFNSDWMSEDLSHFIEPSPLAPKSNFKKKYPCDYLLQNPKKLLKVWHLVGGLDPLEESDLTGNEPDDGHPVLLKDWIKSDKLDCLKIKLRGDDMEWDYERIVRVGKVAIDNDVSWLTADFNCTVEDPEYVNKILDTLTTEEPCIYGKILYIEQPFPYELEKNLLNVRSVSARKPLFLDESAHDWRMVRLGFELGWSGVALKTCKTLTGAILSACWAIEHGMTLMVQDLTNPMLAQITHCQLAAHVQTIMGIESNSMQFYPEASAYEAQFHPRIYKRIDGVLDLSTLSLLGMGYGEMLTEKILPPMESTTI